MEPVNQCSKRLTCIDCAYFVYPFGNGKRGYCKELATATGPAFNCAGLTPKVCAGCTGASHVHTCCPHQLHVPGACTCSEREDVLHFGD